MADDTDPPTTGSTDGPDDRSATRDARPESATVCPFCAVGCSLAPGESPGDRARGIEGPVNPEGRLCRRGIAAFESLERKDRLATPLVRRGTDAMAASWEAALDRATDAIAGVREEHGPDALCFLGAPHSTNEANYLLGKLARALGTNNVDNRARLCHASAMTALETRLGRPAMTNSLDDLGRADVFLVVGANPAGQQPVAFDAAVRPAVADGSTLVHIDPRGNETTRVADVHLAPRPETDPLVVELLCALVREQGLVDEAFVADRTTGYADYAASLDGLDVDAGAAQVGLDRAALERVARLFGSADRCAVIAATGIEHSDHRVTDTADALLNLLLLTGNLGKPGTGMNVLRGLNNEQGATDAGCRPDRLPGHQPVTDAAARARLADAWGFEPPDSPGLDEYRAVERFGESVHGALVVGENPAFEKRDHDWLHERLDALDALVVVDITESETTAYADVVLPGAAALETAGSVTNLDRRVQRVRPAVDPPGEARTDFAVLRSLGHRLVGEPFAFEDPAAAFEEWTRLSPVHRGMTLDAVADGGVRWPVRDGDADGTAVLYEDAFDTSHGRAAFVPVESDPPAADTPGLVLVVGSRAGEFAPDKQVERRLQINPGDAAPRGIEAGDQVVVANDAATVTTTAVVDDGIREGTVFLHAEVADPLVRDDASTVTVRLA